MVSICFLFRILANTFAILCVAALASLFAIGAYVLINVMLRLVGGQGTRSLVLDWIKHIGLDIALNLVTTAAH